MRKHEGHFAETKNDWCLDSGCTAHMGNGQACFDEVRESCDGSVRLAGVGAAAPIRGKDRVGIVANVKGHAQKFDVTDVLRVPDLRTNLLSVSKIADRGYRVVFDREMARVVDKRDRTILTAHRKDGLYYLQNIEARAQFRANLVSNKTSKLEKWYRKMGHLNVRDLVECCRNERVRGMTLGANESDFTCEVCIRGKMTRCPFPKHEPKDTNVLEVIHSDLCGPMRIESNGKARYIVTFVDDYTRWCEMHLLKGKNEILSAFREFKAAAENRHGRKIQFLQTDNGKEFRNDAFDDFLKESGIRRSRMG